MHAVFAGALGRGQQALPRNGMMSSDE